MGSPYAPRRYARECAVHAVYLAEFAKLSMKAALKEVFETYDDPEYREEVIPDSSKVTPENETAFSRFKEYATYLAEGVWEVKGDLDESLDNAIPDYDFDRLAAIDRNILRVATWELLNVDYIAPAVTINEFIEIAKKYSTAESGRFVNGVLATVVKYSDKAHWNAQTAPADPLLSEPEVPYVEPKKEIVEEIVQEGTPEAKTASRYGVWKVRSDSDA